MLESIVGAVDGITALNARIATAAEQQSQVAQNIDQRETHISSLAEQSHGDVATVMQASAQIQGGCSN